MAMSRIPSVIIRNMDMAYISFCPQNGLSYVCFLNIHMYGIQMKKNSFIIMVSQILHSISYPDQMLPFIAVCQVGMSVCTCWM